MIAMLLIIGKIVLARINYYIGNLYLWVYGALALLYLYLAMHFPVSIYTGAAHDDAWFITSAEKILSGQWLGVFDQMTLIKGLGYSYFLAFNNLIGFPITLSLALIYLIACLFFVNVLRKAGLEKITAVILFALLIFQPALFPTRIIRDNIYFSCLLISFSGLIYASLFSSQRFSKAIVAISGLCFGLFWVTREEGIWVLPGFIATTLIFLYIKKYQIENVKETFKSLLIYILGAAVFPFATSFANYSVYGSFQDVDVKHASFVNAINSLNKVVEEGELQYVPVSKKKREAIYKVSSSFKELEQYFEVAGKHWANHGCAIYKHSCGDYAGGWFMWALRDGVASLGYYKNPAFAENYYNRIASEINLACMNGSLKCTTNVIPFMPSLTKTAIQSIPEKFIEAIDLTVYGTPQNLTGGPSSKPVNRFEAIREFLGNPMVVPLHTKLLASGWYYASRDKWISLNCYNNESRKNISIDRLPSSDIALHFNDKNATHQRFSFEIIDFELCGLAFQDAEISDLNLLNFLKSPQKFMRVPNGVIYFDEVQVVELDKVSDPYIKKFLVNIYSSFSIYLFLLGSLLSIATFLVLIYLKRKLNNLIIISLLLWVLYYSRLAVVVMVDVTSFPAINHLYLLPAFPLWSAASVLGIAAFINMAKSIYHLKHTQN